MSVARLETLVDLIAGLEAEADSLADEGLPGIRDRWRHFASLHGRPSREDLERHAHEDIQFLLGAIEDLSDEIRGARFDAVAELEAARDKVAA